MAEFVTVSETVELHRNTVEGLIDTIKEVFADKDRKPVRFVYNKNEPLVVDRRIRKELAGGSMLTAYQMVRQHSDIDIVDSVDDSVRTLARAAQSLSQKRAKTVCIVVNNRFTAYAWFDSELRPEKMLNTEIIEDPECPEDCMFLCGSSTGVSVKDIEFSVLLRM